jgi:hypothetical protein
VVTQYVINVLKQFESRFLSEVRGLQPTFADMVNEKVDPAKVLFNLLVLFSYFYL